MITLRNHPAAARAAAMALDLPGRGIARFGLIVLYSAAGGSMQPWAIKQGVIFLFFLAVAIGMSWLREATDQGSRLPALCRSSW